MFNDGGVFVLDKNLDMFIILGVFDVSVRKDFKMTILKDDFFRTVQFVIASDRLVMACLDWVTANWVGL